MTLKLAILNLYNWPFVSAATRNANQMYVRTMEWNAIKPYVKPGKFLDVGCGSGYAMKLAKEEFGVEAYGIDPSPGAHGVGRNDNVYMDGLQIKQGFSESIPFSENKFDVVYSSHVLEHVNDTDKTLKEICRVLKDDGVIIIGMPTATMAFINAITQYLFTTHHRLVNFFLSGFINVGKVSFKEIFLPPSHSHKGRSVFFDMKYYRMANWEKMLSKHVAVERRICPLLYPYPEYRQLFRPAKFNNFGSSVFFICRKK